MRTGEKKKTRCANGNYIKEHGVIKEDGWSKSIIAQAWRWQHQTYQHQSVSVKAGASQRGMCTRHQLSSGSILRLFVKKKEEASDGGDVCSLWFCCWLFFLPILSVSLSLRLTLHVSAAIIHNRNIHLRRRILDHLEGIIHMPHYILRITWLKTALIHHVVLQMRWEFNISEQSPFFLAYMGSTSRYTIPIHLHMSH